MKILDYLGLTTLVDFCKEYFAKINHTHKVADLEDYTVDSTFSATSENPIQNKAVNEALLTISNDLDAMEASIDSHKDDVNNPHEILEKIEANSDLVVTEESDEIVGDGVDINPAIENKINAVENRVTELENGSANVQADWNQNDENADDYIKNRPFYKVKDSYTVDDRVLFFDEATIDNNSYIEANDSLKTDKKYVVTWDGVEYICEIKYSGGNWYYIGNRTQAGYDDVEDTGEPFMLALGSHYEHAQGTLYYNDENSHTLKIEYINSTVIPDEVVKLEGKYLPTYDWNQNNPNGEGYIENRTHWKDENIVNILQLSTIEEYEVGGEYNQLQYFDLVLGNEYIVEFNGNKYTCIAQIYDQWYPSLGNMSIREESAENTGEPFFLYTYSTHSYVGFFAKESGTITIRITQDNTVYHKIDSKYLPSYDWNQNDPNGSGYIKNRPFWKEEFFAELVPETVVPASPEFPQESYFELAIEKDKTYIVTFDGVKYTCVGQVSEDIGLSYIGNSKLAQIDNNDTSEPFAIVYFDEQTLTFASVDGDHTVKVMGSTNVVYNKIPLEYLPEISSVGKDVAGQSFEVDGDTIQAGVNAEIFNDYDYNIATGMYSHAEGCMTIAKGISSHAEGRVAKASGDMSHAEGSETTAFGMYSHAEGQKTEAKGISSHAEGQKTEATGRSSHAEGYGSVTSNDYSHAEGYFTTASGMYSHSEGVYTKASSQNQHVQGKYNVEDTADKYAHIVGNGEIDNPSNAHTLDWDGNAWFAGNVYVGGTSQDDANAKKLATEDYVNEKCSGGAYGKILFIDMQKDANGDIICKFTPSEVIKYAEEGTTMMIRYCITEQDQDVYMNLIDEELMFIGDTFNVPFVDYCAFEEDGVEFKAAVFENLFFLDVNHIFYLQIDVQDDIVTGGFFYPTANQLITTPSTT